MNHGLPPENWDTALQKLDGSILQSRPWAQVQQALGREVFWDQGNGWRWLAALRVSHGLRYLFCSYGPVGEGAAMEAAVQSLCNAGTQLNADFLRIEPQTGASEAVLREQGAVRIGEVDPQFTRIVDLAQSEAALRDALTSGHRNGINGTKRRGIHIRQTDAKADFNEFLRMLHETAAHSGVRFWPDDYYRILIKTLGEAGVAKLYMAEAEGQPVAAALFYDWGGTRYYAHAGAHQEANRRLKAAVSLVWQALLDAKAAGLKRFDLWGVAPAADRAHHLAGLSVFKAGYGGEQVGFLGTWDIPLHRNKYRLYSLYRHLRGRR